MNIKTVLASLLGWSALALVSSSQADIESVVVFGDSLSDPGNYFQLFGEQEVQPFEPDNVPSAPYASGGHHFTNGETWIEQLTRDLHIAPSGSPATAAPGVFSNYAVGRSRARDRLLDTVFNDENLSSQVDRFIEDHASGAPADALYTLWIGSNDVADALSAFLSGDPGIGQAIIAAGVGNTADQMLSLYLAGAREFLTPSIPDFSMTPRVRNLASGICSGSPAPETCQAQVLSQVSMISAAYNGGMSQVLLGLSQLPDIRIQTLDVNAFLAAVIANPQAFGLENAVDACTAPATTQQAFCQKANDYLFWDGQHPSEAGHRALADYALKNLQID